MEINSKIPYIDVITVAKDLCECIKGKEQEIIYAQVTLKDGEEFNNYLSTIICDKENVEKALIETAKLSGKTMKEYLNSINDDYCHIATFKEDTKRHDIDFDLSSDSPIKANINEEYSYVDAFFRRFINFRNNLIENKQVVKRDDIYQYFLSLTGFEQSKSKKSRKSK